ncbi:GGDEF domain-containing protein [Acinetobacter baumannii]|nr:GGDEF domain-containing protein [Acinetobacter baumannii]MBF6716502.1 GGDEF domain-containing protein [Acinetobacter baumannii]MBF6721242.1 GGDEF domain-containing protein [Acinetobacter baumannii]MBF6725046.1 GGDEF domain-containing protein [Acinetobacter baumannii]MBF6728805.1 GGDEF domain-containing protein [Acinetobacter baumannii]
MLTLACAMNFSWILWKGYILITPSIWQWANLSLVESQIWLNLLTLFLLAVLIIPCYRYKDQAWAQKIVPLISVQAFMLMLCHDGYLIGSISPATMVGYVGTIGVGLVLFERKIVYSAFIPATIILAVCTYLSMTGVISYAPLFNFKTMRHAQTNPFWLGSMLFFIMPILVACFILFEILLTQWRQRETYIQRLSQIDPLTNVLNRRSLNTHLEALHEQQFDYAVILLDIDHFKKINDIYGHHQGDQVLIEIARCLSENLRNEDIIGRFGGEEFILLLPHTDIIQAEKIAERCRQALQELTIFNNQNIQIHVSASFGISSSAFANDPYLVIRQADQALYAVKASGRNQVRTFHQLPQIKSI